MARKSGYARDVMPQVLEAEEKQGLAVLPADKRVHVIPQPQRRQPKMVTAEEANKNMATASRPQDSAPATPAPAGNDFDPFGGEPDPQTLAAEERRLGQGQAGTAIPATARPATPVARTMVKMALTDGCMMLSCTEVMPSDYGVVLLIPNLAEGMMFIPNAGTEVTLSWQNKNGAVSGKYYFPGVTFAIDVINSSGLVFIRKPEGSDGGT